MRLASCAFLMMICGMALSQPGKEKSVYPPEAATRSKLRDRLGRLKTVVAELKQRRVADDVVVEVEIFAKAADWALRHDEWWSKEAPEWISNAIDDGLSRATAAKGGQAGWRDYTGRSVMRGYRSKVDGSAQPYVVTKPASFGRDRSAWRLDVVLHGRDDTLNEVKFIHAHRSQSKPPDDFVTIEAFGRGNNAYRWAGESDVMEALQSFLATEKDNGRPGAIDRRRIVLRGFSMGGAGAWHLGLHYPDKWCVIGPGAGFAQTHGYLKGLPDRLPEPQESLLSIYDAVAYAENAAMVPIVAYVGANDPQKLSAETMAARMKQLSIPMVFLLAPNEAHRMPAEWQRKAETEYAKYASPGKGRPAYPNEVRFTTSTLKYADCDWLSIAGLKRHYQPATVRIKRTAEGFQGTAEGVTRLALRLPPMADGPQKIDLNGQKLSVNPVTRGMAKYVELNLNGTHWQADPSEHAGKRPGLQGPIDDAFTGPFICVRPTGLPMHKSVNELAVAALDRFEKEWDRWLRAELPAKDDTALREEDFQNKNLILFGDPGSNRWIARILHRLPLTWDRKSIKIAGKEFNATNHMPIVIFPNPLNDKRYVVINSGHSFNELDFAGSNAQLYPQIGDYAIVKVDDKRIVLEGLCDEDWRIK